MSEATQFRVVRVPGCTPSPGLPIFSQPGNQKLLHVWAVHWLKATLLRQKVKLEAASLNSKAHPHLKVSQAGDICNKKEQMGLIIINLKCFWIIWPLSCTSSILDCDTYDGHWMGLLEQRILDPDTMVQLLSTDNSQKVERELGKVLSSWKYF